VLVPASMELLGDWNWYFPAWLEWLPRINIEGARQPAPAAEFAAAGGGAGFATADVDRSPDASLPEGHSHGFSVWKLLRRISLALFAVIVLVGALGGTTIGLAVSGGPGQCQAGGGSIVVDDANAVAFDRKWDAFNANLASGSAASVTFNESEITSRLNVWNDKKNVFDEVRVCVHDGYGEVTGKLGRKGAVEAAFKMTGTVELTGHRAVAHIHDIDLGKVPDPVLAVFQGQAEGPIEDALQKTEFEHTYAVTYVEGEVRIDGQP